MNKPEREALITRAKGMSAEELECFLEGVPVELCIKRIEQEIATLRAFKGSMESAFGKWR